MLEGSPEVGGKLRSARSAGWRWTSAPRRCSTGVPRGPTSRRELGLDVVHPAATTSRRLEPRRPAPLPRTLMGVPLDLDDLRRLRGARPPRRWRGCALEPTLPPTELDRRPARSATWSRSGSGEEVVDRLVEPLLGGVYAGHARGSRPAPTTPQLVALLGRGSLLEAAAAARRPSDDARCSPGSRAAWPAARGADRQRSVRRCAPSTTVRDLARAGDGFVPRPSAPTHAPERLAGRRGRAGLPGRAGRPAARRRRAGRGPRARRDRVRLDGGRHARLPGRAFSADLVGRRPPASWCRPVDGRAIKAATFSFAKWDWVARRPGADGDCCCCGPRSGGTARRPRCSASDEELVADSLADLADAIGLVARARSTATCSAGAAALPQYAVGHLDRVARIRADVARVPGWRCAARRTTGWASPRASPRPGAPPPRSATAQWTP